jgi:hypothetical protein
MTAPISTGSSTGWKANHKENGMNMSRKSVAVSGICVTLAILCSGCAAPRSEPMGFTDLDNFQIDCSHRTEQIAFLQSMRSTSDDQLYARASNALQPWLVLTDPTQQYNNAVRGHGRSNWVINQKLIALRDDCRSNP